MSYSSYDRDHLEPASTMRIERTVYFESSKSDISELAALPLEQLQQMREESAAAEQEVFDRLKAQAAAWEEQAGKTLFLDKAIEYVRTPQAAHTANQWEAPDEYRHIRSNAVYQMSYSISENTRYDSTAKKSIPYSWTLRWSIFTNGQGDYRQAKIAGQDRKVFASREELDKYLNGRIKAYEHLFTEIFPAIPQEYADCFKVNGCLLPGYTIEGQQAETKIDRAAEKDAPEPPLSAPVSERSDRMSEVFSIQLHNRQLYEQGRDGVWLDLPTTTEKLQAALREIGITADNPQDFFINGYSYPEDRHLALPYEIVLHADVDELNFLAARLETLDAAALAELNAALQNPKGGFENIGQIIDYADNVDYYVHLPDVKTPAQLGDYYLNRSGMVEMPEEWKGGIDPARFGQHVAGQEQGAFTEYGYLVKSGDEWRHVHEGQPVPEEYRVMAYPAPDVLREESKTRPAPEQPTAEAPPPVVPIILNGQNSADRMKEITDRLETGIQELFESERYKAYLTSMSRFHSYSFNNTLLIAMQGGQLVAGYNKWRDEFHRNVRRGEKGIKILAPAPFKTKKEVPKLDGQGRQIIGRDGKPVTEVQEVQVPAFKVVSVFDVSQTEGEPLPSLAVDELAGSVEDYQDFFKALEQTSPVPVAFEDIPGSSHGYYHLTEKRIAVQEGMSELQTLKTAIHEIAHAKLHAIDPEAPATEQANRPDSRTREVQAESVAYAVCAHYGLDTSDYSFGYVAGWSSGRELKELKASLETIRATAHELITTIDGHLAELQQQRQNQQAAEQPEPSPAQQAAEQPDPDSVFSKLPPEQQQKMTDSVKGMLQSLVEADLKSKGEVSQGTLEAIQTQGYVLAGDGTLQQAEAPEPPHFSIYQLRGDDSTRDYRFEPYDRLQATGRTVDPANYDLVYTAPLDGKTTLEDIYRRFNIDHPADFRGHSLSVSDVVVLNRDGRQEAHYCDSFGFQDVPEFFIQRVKQLAPDNLLTGETVQTPRGTFHVADMTREQMEAAGYGFHHQSEDGKFLIMGNVTQAFAIPAQQESPIKAAEMTTEQNTNMIDGVLNNAPTMGELEAKVKAGEQVSLLDVAEAAKAEAAKTSQRRKAPQEKQKPSIRAQLKAAKGEQAKKPPAREKSKDLEV